MTYALILVSVLATALLGACAVLVIALNQARRARESLPPVDSHHELAAPEVLLDAMPDPFFIVDAGGVVLHANQAAARIFGPPPPVGRPSLETLRDARLADPYRDCRDTGQPAAGITLMTLRSARLAKLPCSAKWRASMSCIDAATKKYSWRKRNSRPAGVLSFG